MRTKEVNSMPSKPALGKGARWTHAKLQRVVGRYVLVGWEDGPAQVQLVTDVCVDGPWKEPNTLEWPDGSCGPTEGRIDSPDQIIAIGPKLLWPKADALFPLPLPLEAVVAIERGQKELLYRTR